MIATLARRPRVVDSFHETRHAWTEVPPDVVEAILQVRRGGWPDMYDRETVMVMAASQGFGEQAEWLAMNRHLYFVALREADRTIDAQR